MTAIEGSGSSTHALGWPLIGLGAGMWLLPCGLLIEHITGQPMISELPNAAVTTTLSIIAATLVGLGTEMIVNPVIERLWVHWARTYRTTTVDASPEEWDSAQVLRWKYSVLDSEFRRLEAFNSFAKSYAFHFVLGTVSWLGWLLVVRGWILMPIALLIGLVAIYVLYRIWVRNTAIINDHKVKDVHRLRDRLS